MAKLKAGDDKVNVVYKVGEMVIDPTDPNSVANRVIRRKLLAIGKEQQAKYGNLVHPDTGERPTIVLVIPKPGSMQMQVRLVTDSPVLRDWLKSMDIHIEDVSVDQGEAVPAPAVA